MCKGLLVLVPISIRYGIKLGGKSHIIDENSVGAGCWWSEIWALTDTCGDMEAPMVYIWYIGWGWECMAAAEVVLSLHNGGGVIFSWWSGVSWKNGSDGTLHFWRWRLALRYGNPYTIWKLMKRRVIWYFGLHCQFSMEHNIGDEKFCSTIMRKMGCSTTPIDLLYQVFDELG